MIDKRAIAIILQFVIALVYIQKRQIVRKLKLHFPLEPSQLCILLSIHFVNLFNSSPAVPR